MLKKVSTSQKVIESAAALFLDKGFHEVSMDRIADRAGITKVTVYQHFGSKEALLAECLRWRLERREAALDNALSANLAPRETLLAIFSWMEANAEKNGFAGCAFLKATSEVAQKYSEVREIALRAKRRLRERCTDLAASAGCQNADMIGSVCALLVDGAQALSLVEQSGEPFRVARTQVAALLDQETQGAYA